MTSPPQCGHTICMKCTTQPNTFALCIPNSTTVILVALFLGVLLSIPTQAETYRGKVDRNQDIFTVYDSNTHRRYLLNFASSIPQLQVARLDDGDYVAVTASPSTDGTNSINVTSVDFVGLSILIGSWKSSDGLCYNFVGYTTFNVFMQPKGLDCSNASPLVPITKYTYFINPDLNDWNMLISSKDHQLFGQLKIHSSKSIEIQLLDSETNAILGTVILRR